MRCHRQVTRHLKLSYNRIWADISIHWCCSQVTYIFIRHIGSKNTDVTKHRRRKNIKNIKKQHNINNWSEGNQVIYKFKKTTVYKLTVKKPGFHSNARNALRKKKYASKICKVRKKCKKTTPQVKNKCSQVMQASTPRIAKCKNRIDPVFHTINTSWQPIGLEDSACVCCLHCLHFSLHATDAT